VSGPNQPAASLAGTVLEGAYRITRLVGEGGMGAVYEAVQLRLNKRVAVKVMSRDLAANSEALARFHREAEITSLLGHAHLVTILDFGMAQTGEPYLVMEYLDGEDLEHRIQRDGRLPIETAVHITRQVASALSAAHAQGVVHRDLKPANIFLLQMAGEPDFVKVLDFGISKMKAARTKLTRALSILGTPNYMSPEQATGMVDEIDRRTDQWALACIAWEMLSGRSPFAADELSVLLYQIINLEPQPLSKRVRDLPPDVEPVLRRALSKQMSDRFPSITDFSRAFAAAALRRPAEVTPPPVMVSRSPVATGTIAYGEPASGTGATMLAGEAEQTLRDTAKQVTTFSQTASEQMNVAPARRFRPVHAIAATVGLVLLMGGFLLLTSRGGPTRPVATQPTVAPVSPPVPVVAPAPVRGPVVIPQPSPAEPLPASDRARPGKTGDSANPSGSTPKRKSPKTRAKRHLIQEL
jgi:serine/threonine protein kinase